MDLTTSVTKLANPIGIIACVICGIMWIASSDQQMVSKAKAWLFRIAIGLIIVNFASTLVNAIDNASKQGKGQGAIVTGEVMSVESADYIGDAVTVVQSI